MGEQYHHPRKVRKGGWLLGSPNDENEPQKISSKLDKNGNRVPSHQRRLSIHLLCLDRCLSFSCDPLFDVDHEDLAFDQLEPLLFSQLAQMLAACLTR